MSFHGTTIGLAPLMAMCSVYQSGGVNMVSLKPLLMLQKVENCLTKYEAIF